MKFKIKSSKLPDIGSVLMRDRIAYSVRILSADEAEIETDIDKERFDEVLEDAECEREMRAYFPHFVPVYSMRTIKNPEKFLRLQKIYRADEDENFSRGRMPIAPLSEESDEFYAWAYPDRPWVDHDVLPACEELVIGMHKIYALEKICGPIIDRVTAYNAAGWSFI